MLGLGEFSAIERQVVSRLAEIERQDADRCSRCTGEDCVCCEIYVDRQKWVPASELFDY